MAIYGLVAVKWRTAVKKSDLGNRFASGFAMCYHPEPHYKYMKTNLILSFSTHLGPATLYAILGADMRRGICYHLYFDPKSLLTQLNFCSWLGHLYMTVGLHVLRQPQRLPRSSGGGFLVITIRAPKSFLLPNQVNPCLRIGPRTEHWNWHGDDLQWRVRNLVSMAPSIKEERAWVPLSRSMFKLLTDFSPSQNGAVILYMSTVWLRSIFKHLVPWCIAGTYQRPQ